MATTWRVCWQFLSPLDLHTIWDSNSQTCDHESPPFLKVSEGKLRFHLKFARQLNFGSSREDILSSIFIFVSSAISKYKIALQNKNREKVHRYMCLEKRAYQTRLAVWKIIDVNRRKCATGNLADIPTMRNFLLSLFMPHFSFQKIVIHQVWVRTSYNSMKWSYLIIQLS